MTREQIIAATIATAAKEVGVREIGSSNRGQRVDEYQRADLLPGVGYSWCVSFQDWDMLTTLGQPLCDSVWYRSASCDEILYWARRKGIVSTTPEAGCQGLVMASKNDATHIFKVEKVLPGASQTIEGNTNTDGSANGNGVYRRHRPFAARYLYVLWQRLLPASATLPGQVTLPVIPVADASPFDHCPLYDLYLGGKLVAKVPSLHGKTWLPAWKWAEWMNTTVAWQAATQSVLIAGREVTAQPLLVDGRAWLPVTKLAAHNGLVGAFDADKQTVMVGRPSLIATAASK